MNRLLLFLIAVLICGQLSAQDSPQIGINVGQIAPEIALPTPEGDTVKLSSLRGQLVLIDFWAAWCGPCRKENPFVVKAYREFKNKKFTVGTGFTVYGVSLDRDRNQWIAAIEKDSLAWTNVSELMQWNGLVSKIYGIRSIPSNLLIDGNGVILAKNLRGPALDETLNQLLKVEPVVLFDQNKKELDANLFEMLQSEDYIKHQKRLKKIEKRMMQIQSEIDIIKQDFSN